MLCTDTCCDCGPSNTYSWCAVPVPLSVQLHVRMYRCTCTYVQSTYTAYIVCYTCSLALRSSKMEKKEKNECPLWGSNSRPSDYETDALPSAPRGPPITQPLKPGFIPKGMNIWHIQTYTPAGGFHWHSWHLESYRGERGTIRGRV